MRSPDYSRERFVLMGLLAGAMLVFLGGCAATAPPDHLRREVDATIEPMMREHRIPGMAVAVLHDGRVEFFNYGVASRETGAPVDENTLFEVGSVSKVFTGLLGAYVSAQGHFALNDPVCQCFPALAASAFDGVTMLELATYSAGGLPLQFPAEVVTDGDMLAYFRAWSPEFEQGARRRYSNPSIGLFGRAAAKSAGKEFTSLMTGTLFPALGLRHTHIDVPPEEAERYAFGYARDDAPIRVNPGVFDDEAYGVKTSAADMSRFVLAQMVEPNDPTLAEAIALTRVGRFTVGPMTQGLGWEMYAYPVALEDLLAGNSPEMIFQANPVSPPVDPGPAVLLNKTGSTGGFGAYVVCVPARGIGVVLLANRNYPISARVAAAYRILEAVGE